MRNLDRLIAARAFEITGVDFAGPLYVEPDRAPSVKVYLMLFTCAVVRAVHLEVVPNLTTRCCLNAIRRFVSRRGLPRIIYSDNAKTFKRVDFEIQQLYKNIDSCEISSYAANRGIRWKFIVERAPWWGGWWERMIRTIKNALKATIGRANLTYEQLETTLIEIEATINSRPLTYLSSDSSALKPLTPADFLLDTGITSIIDINTGSSLKGEGLNELWKIRQKILNKFWKRWTSEYICQLRSAHESRASPTSIIKIGDVVLLQEPNQPRLMWKLARIVQIFPGRDGKIRACQLRLANKTHLRRSVQAIYPLEVC